MWAVVFNATIKLLRFNQILQIQEVNLVTQLILLYPQQIK